MDELQHRRLDLGEASSVQRVAHAVDDGRTDIGHFAGLWSHDQVDIACSDASFGIGEPLVLVGQGTNCLAGDHERFGADRQLAALGSDHLARHAYLITKIDITPPALQHVRPDRVKSDHDLQIAGAVTKGGEAQLAAISTEDDPASDRDLPTGTGVRGKLTGLCSDLSERMRAREGHWIRIDALSTQSIQLFAAYPDLLRQAFGGQGLGESIGFLRNVCGDLSRVFLASPFQGTRARLFAVPLQHRQRRACQEPFGAARGGPDTWQIGGVLEADIARLPFRLVLGVGAVEGFQLPVAAGEHECLPPQSGDRPGAELGTAFESLAEHGEVQRHPADAEHRGPLRQRGHHQLHQTVVCGGIAAHQIEREAVATPWHKAEERSQVAFGIVRLHQHALGVQRIPEAAQAPSRSLVRHRRRPAIGRRSWTARRSARGRHRRAGPSLWCSRGVAVG